jgi:hypothetical protein
MLANPDKEFKLLTAPHLKWSPKEMLLLLTAKNNWKSMRNTDCRLLQSKNYKCFLPKRIRFQIFFMKLDCVKLHLEVEKEESIDLDKFDQYPPSFLWDDDAKKLQEHIEWD